MNTHHRFALAGGFVVFSAFVSVIAAPELPDQVVSNWNAAGEPSGTLSKPLALGLVPALTAGLLGIFAVIPRIDPLRSNISEFRPYYDWFVVVFAAYLFIIHTGIIAFNLGYEFDFVFLILLGVAGLFYYCGVLLTHTKRNWFVGIRTPWTLSNEEVWDQTHTLGGKLFKLTAILVVVGLLFGEYALYFLLVPAVVTAVFTVVYSYYLYEQIEQDDSASSDSGL